MSLSNRAALAAAVATAAIAAGVPVTTAGASSRPPHGISPCIPQSATMIPQSVMIPQTGCPQEAR